MKQYAPILRSAGGLALALAAALPAVAADALAPADLLAHAADRDNAAVTVAGAVRSFQQRKTPIGTVSLFKLCDTACVMVVDKTGAKHAEGDSVTVSGTFHVAFKTRQGTVKNAVEVGG